MEKKNKERELAWVDILTEKESFVSMKILNYIKNNLPSVSLLCLFLGTKITEDGADVNLKLDEFLIDKWPFLDMLSNGDLTEAERKVQGNLLQIIFVSENILSGIKKEESE